MLQLLRWEVEQFCLLRAVLQSVGLCTSTTDSSFSYSSSMLGAQKVYDILCSSPSVTKGTPDDQQFIRCHPARRTRATKARQGVMSSFQELGLIRDVGVVAQPNCSCMSRTPLRPVSDPRITSSTWGPVLHHRIPAENYYPTAAPVL